VEALHAFREFLPDTMDNEYQVSWRRSCFFHRACVTDLAAPPRRSGFGLRAAQVVPDIDGTGLRWV
jgi:hypothetical protein